MASEQSDFSQILNSLLSVDNAVRKSAEVSHIQKSQFFSLFSSEPCKWIEQKKKKKRVSIVIHILNQVHAAEKTEQKKCPQCAVN